MPSPATPRRASNRIGSKTPSKSSPLDIGTPLGPYDNNSVRERIRAWQAQGGGVVTTSDLYTEDNKDENRATKDTPKSTPRQHTPRKSTGLRDSETPTSSDRQGGRRKEVRDAREENRVRSVSAPRKRVVSDEHWKSSRSSHVHRHTSSPRKTNGSSKAFDDDGIRIRPLPDPMLENQPNKTRDRSKPKRSGDMADDGIRVYSTPPLTKIPLTEEDLPDTDVEIEEDVEHSSDGSRDHFASDQDRHSETSSHSQRSNRKPKVPTKWATGSNPQAPEKELSKKVNRTRRTGPVRSPRLGKVAFSEERGSKRSSKNIFGHVLESPKRIFGKQAAIAEPTYVPSPVEAWLNGTDPADDPFVAAEPPPGENTDNENMEELLSTQDPSITAIQYEPSIQEETISQDQYRKKLSPRDEPANEPDTKEARTQRHLRRRRQATDDPNKIWDVLNAKDGLETQKPQPRRRSRRQHSITDRNGAAGSLEVDNRPRRRLHVDTDKAENPEEPNKIKEPETPTTLKRRGASRSASSPVKVTRASSPVKEGYETSQRQSAEALSADTATSETPFKSVIARNSSGLEIPKDFASLGDHRLSTIASVETFSGKDQNSHEPSIAPSTSTQTEDPHLSEDYAVPEARDQFDPNILERRTSKSRIARHADLISILSMPLAGSRSIRSARSIRSNRSHLGFANIEEAMTELAADEANYRRELRTLTDGVIPVLLSSVLSKSDSALAAGLFNGSNQDVNDPKLMQPIIDMGVALERLKSVHESLRRLLPKGSPVTDPQPFLRWAHGAQSYYANYLKSWRCGFQDVIVNLAPAEDRKPDVSEVGTSLGSELLRNEEGDVINDKGERVDVAFLLKRPLVRIKYLSKALKSISALRPSAQAQRLEQKFSELVVEARNRCNEERARLEDEAAVRIDPTKSRDLSTLGPSKGVTIDQNRRVRAKDVFQLTLFHSNQQAIDCRVELLLRDDPPEKGSGGDLLICELDSQGRWLLIPPVEIEKASARNGDAKGEIVIMIRGTDLKNGEWQELLSLRGDDEQAGFEWVQMLGLTPVPPQITRAQSFVNKSEAPVSLAQSSIELESTSMSTSIVEDPSKFQDPEVPFGEQTSGKTRKRHDKPGREEYHSSKMSPVSRLHTKLQKRRSPLPSTSPPVKTDRQVSKSENAHHRRRSRTVSEKPLSPAQDLNEAMERAGTQESGLKRTTAKRISRNLGDSSQVSKPLKPSQLEEDLQIPSATTPQIARMEGDECCSRGLPIHSHQSQTFEDVRAISSLSTPKRNRGAINPLGAEEGKAQRVVMEELAKDIEVEDTPPTPPPHRSPSPALLPQIQKSDLEPVQSQPQRKPSSPLKYEYEPSSGPESSSDSESDASTVGQVGAPESPHESDDGENNEEDDGEDNEEDEDELERDDIVPSLVAIPAHRHSSRKYIPRSLPSLPTGTLGPSSSASQAPYKTVPVQPGSGVRAIASIFNWGDSFEWEKLHPVECSIKVSPGLIEAFEMTSAHSAGASGEEYSSDRSPEEHMRPLIALELTPMVLLHVGAAIDINIRSPATNNSTLSIERRKNNFLFRSRSIAECQRLYNLVHEARFTNPTWIALEKARAASADIQGFGDPASNGNGGSQKSSRGGFFFSFGRSNSYRAKSAPTPSISKTESSIATMASAFSALKLFGNDKSRFSISRSTVTSRYGSGAHSAYPQSEESSGSGARSPPIGGPEGGANEAAAAAASLGIRDAKIRLYVRQSASKWRDLGAARLTIMHPEDETASSPATASGDGALKDAPASADPDEVLSEGASTPRLTALGMNASGAVGEAEASKLDAKRVLVVGKRKGETLLDVTLHKDCFERVARTGIAVEVWEDNEGGLVSKQGGVIPAKRTVYMIQMSGEKDAAYTFSIVGRLRWSS